MWKPRHYTMIVVLAFIASSKFKQKSKNKEIVEHG